MIISFCLGGGAFVLFPTMWQNMKKNKRVMMYVYLNLLHGTLNVKDSL